MYFEPFTMQLKSFFQRKEWNNTIQLEIKCVDEIFFFAFEKEKKKERKKTCKYNTHI